MGNGREIVSRLDPKYFHVSMFVQGAPDSRIRLRKNTRLIHLPKRKQTLRILSEFLWGEHSLLFYLKASPASRWYLSLRQKYPDQRTTIGTMESQANLYDEPTIPQQARRLFELTVLRCDHLFSNCLSVQRSLLREYGRNSQLIPTGVDTQFFTPDWERPQNQRARVLFVGSLRPFKQPQFLLSAAARYPQADFRIAGEGPLGPELAATIDRNQLRNVSLLGLLNADQLRSEYRQADLLLFPSSWEGSPKVVLEAAACGLPVIVRSNYFPETVVHGNTGFQEASDVGIYTSLDALLANSELRRNMGRAARLHSLLFDWSVIVAQWEQTFARLASETGMRRAS